MNTKVTVVGGGLAGIASALSCADAGAEVTLVAPPTLLPVGVQSWPCAVSYDLDAVLPELILLRRHLHSHPELSGHEQQTDYPGQVLGSGHALI